MDFNEDPQSYELAEEGLTLPSSEDAYRAWCKLRGMGYLNGDCVDAAAAQAACYAQIPPGTWIGDEFACVAAAPIPEPGQPGGAPAPAPGAAPRAAPRPAPCNCPPSEGYPIAVVAAVAAGAALLGYAVSR
jgi:hypothetical protein